LVEEVVQYAAQYSIQYADVAVGALITLGLIKFLPTRWFSREEKYRHESKVRLKKRLRK
jgi:hypothetical protein